MQGPSHNTCTHAHTPGQDHSIKHVYSSVLRPIVARSCHVGITYCPGKTICEWGKRSGWREGSRLNLELDIHGTQTHSQMACGMEHSIGAGTSACVPCHFLKQPDVRMPIAPEYSHVPSVYYAFFYTGVLWSS